VTILVRLILYDITNESLDKKCFEEYIYDRKGEKSL